MLFSKMFCSAEAQRAAPPHAGHSAATIRQKPDMATAKQLPMTVKAATQSKK